MAKDSAPRGKNASKTVALNRRARFDYAIEEEIEAGLVLQGTEVKSLRAGRANINDAYAAEKNGELWLLNATVMAYEAGNRFNHEPKRPRKLLVHKKQASKLIGRLKVRGVTLVAMSLYFNSRGIAKIKLGLATGKKEYDKRATIKERDWKREQARIMKR